MARIEVTYLLLIDSCIQTSLMVYYVIVYPGMTAVGRFQVLMIVGR